MRELGQTPINSQPVVNQFKPTNSRSGGHRGHTCGKCGKIHDGVCRSSSSTCHNCVREGQFAKDCLQQAP